MTARVQVLLAEEEKAALEEQARRENRSLSSWLKKAALDRLAAVQGAAGLRTKGELRAFFRACDSREKGREPDWGEHLLVIEKSRRAGTAE